MGKREKPLGVKRKRGKKFEWREDSSLTLTRTITSKSVFRDKRLGEKNPNLSQDQKSLLRYQRERELRSRRKQRFELDDDIQLTHKGVRLSELQDDYVEDYELDLSDEDSPQKHPKLSDEIVKSFHFGDGKTQSKKDAYEELIQKWKQNKLDRQQEKEEIFEATKKIDGDFEDISRRLKFKDKEKEKQRDEERDDFDELVLAIRDDTKNIAEGGEVKGREIRKEMEERGENWTVPEGFKEFVVRVREDPVLAVKKMKVWSDCEVKRVKAEMQERLLGFSLKFFVEEMEDGQEEEMEAMEEVIFGLCKEYQRATEKVIMQICENFPEGVRMSLAYFYHLVYLLFPIKFEDKLTLTLAYSACDLFVQFPLNSPATVRNLLYLSQVFLTFWLGPSFSPELCRFLSKVLSLSPKLTDSLQPYFPSGVKAFAQSLILSLNKSFGKFSVFHQIFSGFDLQLEQTEKSALKLYERPIQEIETFEPMIYANVRSNKKNKDLNKEVTEIDRLREQQKRARKLAKRALEKETEVEQFDKSLEFEARNQAVERKQGLVKNMLDEMQAEFKRFDTSMVKKKEKKKRKERMAGGRTEQNKGEKKGLDEEKGGRGEKKGWGEDKGGRGDKKRGKKGGKDKY